MSSSIKNYTEQGGSRTVIGGELVIEEGAQIIGLPSSNGNASAVVLDMQGYNIFNAIGEDQDITEIISPEVFERAASGLLPVIISNVAVGGMSGSFSLQGVETSQGQMIFGFGIFPNVADIGPFISVRMVLSQSDDEVKVLFRSSLNFDMNEKLGFSLD